MRQTRKSRIRSERKAARKAVIERFLDNKMVTFAGCAVGQAAGQVVLFFLEMYFK